MKAIRYYKWAFYGIKTWKDTSHEAKENQGEDNMIRLLRKTGIEKVADIWLNTNNKIHCLINKNYWQNYFHIVKEWFSRLEVYVISKREVWNSGRSYWWSTGEKEYLLEWKSQKHLFDLMWKRGKYKILNHVPVS